MTARRWLVEIMSANEALQAAARELTRLLSLIDPDDPHHEPIVESMGTVAIRYREAAQKLK